MAIIGLIWSVEFIWKLLQTAASIKELLLLLGKPARLMCEITVEPDSDWTCIWLTSESAPTLLRQHPLRRGGYKWDRCKMLTFHVTLTCHIISPGRSFKWACPFFTLVLCLYVFLCCCWTTANAGRCCICFTKEYHHSVDAGSWQLWSSDGCYMMVRVFVWCIPMLLRKLKKCNSSWFSNETPRVWPTVYW